MLYFVTNSFETFWSLKKNTENEFVFSLKFKNMEYFTINHLIDKTLFDKEKRDFLARDFNFRNSLKNDEEVDLDMNENDITVFQEKVKSTKIEYDSMGFPHNVDEIEIIEQNLNFFDDYLPIKIDGLLEYYKEQFKMELVNKNIYSDNSRKNYSQLKLNTINENIITINKSDFLTPEIINKAVGVLEKIYEFVDNDFYQIYLKVPLKIPLNLSKIEVITLFHLLYQNKIIVNKGLQEHQIASLIEQNFTFYKSKQVPCKPIKEARKLMLEHFGPKAVKNPQKAINVLKNKFSNPDFYSI